MTRRISIVRGPPTVSRGNPWEGTARRDWADAAAARRTPLS